MQRLWEKYYIITYDKLGNFEPISLQNLSDYGLIYNL